MKRKERVKIYHSEGLVFEGKVKLPRRAVKLSQSLDKKEYRENLGYKG